MADRKTLKDWEVLVAKQTKGAGPDSLVWHTPEGIDVKALYTRADLEGIDFVDSLPDRCQVQRWRVVTGCLRQSLPTRGLSY